MAVWKAIVVGSGFVGAIVGGLYYWWNNRDKVTPDKHAIPDIKDAVIPDVMNQTEAEIPITEDDDEVPDIKQDPDIEVAQVDVYDNSDHFSAETDEDNQSADDPSQVLPSVSAVEVVYETFDISDQSAEDTDEDNQSADDPPQVLPLVSTVDSFETFDISEQSAEDTDENNQSADDPPQILPSASAVDAYETGEETSFTPSEYVEAYHNLPNKPHILEQVKHFFEEKIGLVFFIDSTLINDITTRARIIFMNQTDARKAFSLDGATFLGSKIKIKVFIDGYQVPCDMETSEAPPVEQNGILDHSYFPSIAPYAPISMEPGGEYIIASNFPNSMTAVELIEFFQTHVGPVNSCGMFSTDPINGDRLNISKARISFRNRGHAEMALIVLDNSMLLGQPLEIQLFIDERRFYREQVIFHPPESSGVYQQHVHISGLPPSTTGAQIIEHFWKLVGPVKSVGFELDARGFATNGNAMLVFQSPFDNLKALCYDNSVFNDSQLKMLLITYEPSYEPSEIMK